MGDKDSPSQPALLEAQKTAILEAVNSKISGLESTLQIQQEELAINLSQNQFIAPAIFKKKGNEQQFKFKEKVITCHKQASKALELNNAARAKVLLEQGIVLLDNRQKLIKIADKSEFGWSTILWRVNGIKINGVEMNEAAVK